MSECWLAKPDLVEQTDTYRCRSTCQRGVKGIQGGNTASISYVDHQTRFSFHHQTESISLRKKSRSHCTDFLFLPPQPTNQKRMERRDLWKKKRIDILVFRLFFFLRLALSLLHLIDPDEFSYPSLPHKVLKTKMNRNKIDITNNQKKNERPSGGYHRRNPHQERQVEKEEKEENHE